MNFLSIIFAWLVCLVSPGPDFFVTSESACQSRRAGYYCVIGVSLGILVWCVGALFGLALAFESSPTFYQVVKLSGANYLIYLGVTSLLPKKEKAVVTYSHRGAFYRGLFTNLSNPKAVVLFSSIFVTFIPKEATFDYKALVAATVFLTGLFWYILVVTVVNVESVKSKMLQFQDRMRFFFGVIFIALGLYCIIDAI